MKKKKWRARIDPGHYQALDAAAREKTAAGHAASGVGFGGAYTANDILHSLIEEWMRKRMADQPFKGPACLASG